jgi:hypothetical protein
VKWNKEQLLAAVKELPPDEFREFDQQLSALRRQTGHGNVDSAAETDAELLRCIRKNSFLPATAQRRFNGLRQKRQVESLTKSEEKELQGLWRQVEQMNVSRLEALVKLSRRTGTDVHALTHLLGLHEEPDAL